MIVSNQLISNKYCRDLIALLLEIHFDSVLEAGYQPPSLQIANDEAKRRRFVGTNEWVFGNETYKAWSDRQTPDDRDLEDTSAAALLWIYGASASTKIVSRTHLTKIRQAWKRQDRAFCNYC